MLRERTHSFIYLFSSNCSSLGFLTLFFYLSVFACVRQLIITCDYPRILLGRICISWPNNVVNHSVIEQNKSLVTKKFVSQFI